jgi:hypothetical protein
MSAAAIPNWNSLGVLPPINQADPTSTFDRSPYPVLLSDIISRFATTTDRQAVLAGFLAFRTALHAVGLTSGFQWINGSFTEDIENIGGRAPHDIDVVTFYRLPPGKTQQDILTAQPQLFAPKHTKIDYQVDAYFVLLDGNSPEPLVGQSAYWYSLWSHKRDGQWKGYLAIDLSSADDPVAKTNLDRMMGQGGRL